MRRFLVLLGCLLVSLGPGAGGRARPRWAAPVGITNYKSTIVVRGGTAFVGTRGHPAVAGVWAVDGRTGRSRRIFLARGADNDVAGLACDGTYLYFGTDNGDAYKITLDGRRVWLRALGSFVRGSPALGRLNSDDLPDAVIATGRGEVIALDGKTGEPIWSFDAAEGRQSPNEFVATPALCDVTGDGAPDAFLGCRNGEFYALDGATGKLLWARAVAGAIHASAVVLLREFDAKGADEEALREGVEKLGHQDIAVRDRATRDLVAAGFAGLRHVEAAFVDADAEVRARARSIAREIRVRESPNVVVASVDGRIVAFRAFDGEEIWSVSLKGWGFYASPAPLDAEASRWIIGCSTGGGRDGFVIFEPGGRAWTRWAGGRISSSAVVLGDRAILGVENGDVIAADAAVRRRQFAWVAGPVECTPAAADLDGDGTLEVLVAARDGFLYCFETDVRGPAMWGRFHGDESNSGVFRLHHAAPLRR